MLKKLTWGGITVVLIFAALILGSYAPVAWAQVFNFTNGTQGYKVVLFDSGGTEVTSLGGGGDGTIIDGNGTGEADVINTDPVGTEEGLVVRISGLSRDCDSHQAIDTATSGNVELIAPITGEIIVVCQVTVLSGSTTANNVQFVYGHGTACATGETNITGLVTLDLDSSLPGFTAGNDGGIYFPPIDEGFCIELSGATQISGSVSYVQYDPTP